MGLGLLATAILLAPLQPALDERLPTAQMAPASRSRYSLTVDLDPPRPRPPPPRIDGPAGRPLVVIDAGHGGHDPGAIAPDTGVREKDLTLAVARAIRTELLRQGRVRVALTRDDDRFLVLEERREIARALKAGLFISVHADAGPVREASGATIYTLSEVASDARAAELAARENRADVINGVNLSRTQSGVSAILIDLSQRETMAASARFADLLKREGTGIVFRPDHHRMAGFVVLKAPDTPAILLEVGYITSPEDVARLRSPNGQQAIATGVARAVAIHFARQLTGQ